MSDTLPTNSNSTTEIQAGSERPDPGPVLRAVERPSYIPGRLAVDFKQLDDGRLVELIEDPNDATKTKFAVFDNGNVCLADSVDYPGQTRVPMPRTNDGFEEITLPRTLMLTNPLARYFATSSP